MSIVVPAILLNEYLAIRKIRNDNYQNLTGVRRKIGLWEQIKFFMFKPKNVSVFVSFTEGKISGYMLIKETEKGALITEVVDKKYRNKGIAKKMIREAQDNYPVVVAEIWKGNIPSVCLHERMGFKLTGEYNQRLIYTWRHNDN